MKKKEILNWKIKTLIRRLDTHVEDHFSEEEKHQCNCKVGYLGNGIFGYHHCGKRKGLLNTLHKQK